ncbi:DNA recombination protein RmuC, partial [bacterium]|nr:DNA recombination protein RmuC [bacterium]
WQQQALAENAQRIAEVARAELAAAAERSEAARRFAEEQKEFVAHSRKELSDSFQALASVALRGNNEEFLRLAEERWKATQQQAASDLDARRTGIESLLAPLRDTLGRLESQTASMEKEREGAYQGLVKELEGLRSATSSLEERTTSLDTALRGAGAQGRWGEIALQNVVELAGLTEQVDFVTQEQLADGKRPDMTVRLPGNRFIAVDSKVSLTAYLEAAEATSTEQRNAALDRHVQSLRSHVKTLADRDYAANVQGDVDLVVMFLPGDAFLGAAFSRSPDLQTEAMRSRVLVTTPTTLVALLRTVAIYWQQQALAENAQRIAEVARELYERGARFEKHFDRVGKGLSDAVGAFNDAVGSFERRFLPMARQLEDLKVTNQMKLSLDAPAIVEEAPRRSSDIS